MRVSVSGTPRFSFFEKGILKPASFPGVAFSPIEPFSHPHEISVSAVQPAPQRRGEYGGTVARMPSLRTHAYRPAIRGSTRETRRVREACRRGMGESIEARRKKTAINKRNTFFLQAPRSPCKANTVGDHRDFGVRRWVDEGSLDRSPPGRSRDRLPEIHGRIVATSGAIPDGAGSTVDAGI